MCEIKENFSLKKYNTFGIDVKSSFFVSCSSVQELVRFFNSHDLAELPLMILGGGSNVLFTKDFEGFVIQPAIKGIELINENNQSVWLRVGAGEDWDEFVSYCVEHNWGGIENLSLIPGNVGTCPIQNIGAYGVEVKDVITKVETLEIATLNKYSFLNNECHFGYRDSIFKKVLKGKHIITNVTFKLTKQPEFNIEYGNLREALKSCQNVDLKSIRDAVIEIRESKLPKPEEVGNAGSFFKNPMVHKDLLEKLKVGYADIPYYILDDKLVKIPAGWLIEKAGWKGKVIGNTGVHDKQALVLINLGNARGSEVIQLANHIQESVKKQFGIDLEMEVNII